MHRYRTLSTEAQNLPEHFFFMGTDAGPSSWEPATVRLLIAIVGECCCANILLSCVSCCRVATCRRAWTGPIAEILDDLLCGPLSRRRSCLYQWGGAVRLITISQLAQHVRGTRPKTTPSLPGLMSCGARGRTRDLRTSPTGFRNLRPLIYMVMS